MEVVPRKILPRRGMTQAVQYQFQYLVQSHNRNKKNDLMALNNFVGKMDEHCTAPCVRLNRRREDRFNLFCIDFPLIPMAEPAESKHTGWRVRMEPAKVVVRIADGRILKGFTQDFFPNRDRFHLHPAEGTQGKKTEIFLGDLKAVFFVRDFAGNPQYDERKTHLADETFQGRIGRGDFFRW